MPRESAAGISQSLNDRQLSEGVLALRIVEGRLGHDDYVACCRGTCEWWSLYSFQVDSQSLSGDGQ